jgi:hypothetical protein
MVAYSFKRQFVEPIRIGLGLPPLVLPPARPKRQTIRADRRRHARPGEWVQLYTAMRTKACEHIGNGMCIAVTRVHLQLDLGIVSVEHHPAMRNGDLDAFAQADGFDDWPAMRAFWKAEHGVPTFEGVIIYWRP